MKIALITDTHFGARGDHQVFDDFFRLFYDKIFFPVIDEIKVEGVIDLGDTFDRRKFINFHSLNSCREYYFDKLAERNLHLDLLVGNHCTFYRNTNAINSPKLLLGSYDNIDVIEDPIQVMYDDLPLLFLPWICDSNRQQALDMIDKTAAQIVFGHLEIDGFEMYRGQPNLGGERPSLFSKFESVYSGHFHHRSTKGNITYLGNPYEMTWSDYDDPRGFHIFDTDTRKVHFIENPYKMFHKVSYDDTTDMDYYKEPVKQFAERYVKVIVVNKTDQLMFDTYIDRMYNVNPLEIKIIEHNAVDYDDANADDKMDVEDTPTLLEHYIDALETDLDKTKLKTFLKGLYVEAQALEEG